MPIGPLQLPVPIRGRGRWWVLLVVGGWWVLLVALAERVQADGQRLHHHLLASAQRVGLFNIGSGRVGYWTKYRVAGRVRVG